MSQLIVAYEPIWAIGTGKTATADQAEEVCKEIRDYIRSLYDDETADAVRHPNMVVVLNPKMPVKSLGNQILMVPL